MKLVVALAAASGHMAGAELQLPLPQDPLQTTSRASKEPLDRTPNPGLSARRHLFHERAHR